ncbi:hypothetical protein KO500_05335 [Cellulophaga baltica]|uniref:DUF7009 family protein n=1 Tax=Cellulophaga TaxID=104264 RepID=UPI001C070C89|nr:MULTISPECIES: hypothetical protein [Cellulophaga]MBU2995844.1 hypothetical protein [Cellulophaga baltica]MDO6767239.1 hypothetical protein [Cellulophaga sp. 1_MG-2023]
MKIRIKGNTLRYRLTKSEVEEFCRTGYYKEQTEFPTTQFMYELKAGEVNTLEADFSNNTVTVLFPIEATKDWATNSVVGFNNVFKTASDIEIGILIEKDFVCMDETVEDQSDNYPNPKA